ncbi:MAG: shikimate kinase [Candidatus Promineifilaceae bacterium]|jgi:shikimate kinase
MNIVLIGYRGTGKSVVGKRVAEVLDRQYVGLDAAIVDLAGQSIPEVVEAHGWAHFRDLESDVVRQASERDNCVLDTGGGAILRDANVTHLKQNGTLIWLQSSVADIVARIGDDNQRPSLTGTKSFTEEVEEVLAERTPKYAAAADHVIDDQGLSIEQVTQKVIALLS